MSIRIVDTEAVSKQIRETFHQSPSKKRIPLSFSWPTEMRRIGTSRAIMYFSDKWGKTQGEMYKHRSEAPCDVYLSPMAKIYDEDGYEIVEGEYDSVSGQMPKHIAVLGKSLGIQVKLDSGRKVQIDFAGAVWGAAKNPDTGETFLVMFTPREVLMVVVGDSLGVERDGIVG